MMKNFLNNRMTLFGSVALVAILALSTQSANAQGFSNQPNRNGHPEPNRAVIQQHPQYHSPMTNQKSLPSQYFGHQNRAPKKVESARFAHNRGPKHHNTTPVFVPAPCNHQPAPQIVVVGQPKKPNLFERIVNVFR